MKLVVGAAVGPAKKKQICEVVAEEAFVVLKASFVYALERTEPVVSVGGIYLLAVVVVAEVDIGLEMIAAAEMDTKSRN